MSKLRFDARANEHHTPGVWLTTGESDVHLYLECC